MKKFNLLALGALCSLAGSAYGMDSSAGKELVPFVRVPKRFDPSGRFTLDPSKKCVLINGNPSEASWHVSPGLAQGRPVVVVTRRQYSEVEKRWPGHAQEWLRNTALHKSYVRTQRILKSKYFNKEKRAKIVEKLRRIYARAALKEVGLPTLIGPKGKPSTFTPIAPEPLLDDNRRLPLRDIT